MTGPLGYTSPVCPRGRACYGHREKGRRQEQSSHKSTLLQQVRNCRDKQFPTAAAANETAGNGRLSLCTMASNGGRRFQKSFIFLSDPMRSGRSGAFPAAPYAEVELKLGLGKR
jgi:hypothetical protein